MEKLYILTHALCGKDLLQNRTILHPVLLPSVFFYKHYPGLAFDPKTQVLMHKNSKIPRFDPQEKSLMRHFDPPKILGTASKFNMTYQKSIYLQGP